MGALQKVKAKWFIAAADHRAMAWAGIRRSIPNPYVTLSLFALEKKKKKDSHG
jgi:hypothetical protein